MKNVNPQSEVSEISEQRHDVGFALRLQRKVESEAEEDFVRGLTKAIREGQASKDPFVASVFDDLAELVNQVRDGERRAERIAFGMR